jgi:exopolysaccharide production protein ExoQ
LSPKRKGQRWYYLVSVVFLLEASEAFGVVDRLIYGQWDNKGGDVITQSLNLLMIVTSLLLIWRAKRIGTGGILALAMAGFLLLSAVWSIDPQTTLRRGTVYLFIIVGSIGIVGNFEDNDVIELVRVTCGLSAAASIVVLLIFPSAAFIQSSELRGVFSHKNGLGEIMALGVLVSLHSMRADRRNRFFKICILFLFVIIAFFSRSSTALLMILAFCGGDFVIALLRKGGTARIFGIFLTVFLVLTSSIIALDPDWFLEMIGKDPTLTGRTELWSYVLVAIEKRPLLGWGYLSFWSATNPDALAINSALRWNVPSAHNALLAVLLDVGILGAAVFIGFWVRCVAFALRCTGTSAKELAISSLLFYVGFFLVGVNEPVLSEPGILLITFVMTGLMCERALRAARRRRISTAPRATPGLVPTHPQGTNFRTR